MTFAFDDNSQASSTTTHEVSALLLGLSLLYSCLCFQKDHLPAPSVHTHSCVSCVVMLNKPEPLRKQDPMIEDRHKKLRRKAGILCVTYVLIHSHEV